MMSERKNLKTICKKTARTFYINQIKKGLSIDKPFKKIIFSIQALITPLLINCIAKIAPRKNTDGIPNAFTAKVLIVNTGYPSPGLPLSATIAVSSQTCWF